jgi:hypothetical protein
MKPSPFKETQKAIKIQRVLYAPFKLKTFAYETTKGAD